VGIISQPDLNSSNDILSLGVPELFWGISAGAVDSMVANYTPLMKNVKMMILHLEVSTIKDLIELQSST